MQQSTWTATVQHGCFGKAVSMMTIATPSAANAVLRYMVAGESDAEHLNEATELFNRWPQQHAGANLMPPDNIRDKINAKQFGEKIVEADKLAKAGDYKGARTKLDEAGHLSSLDDDAKAHKLDEEVRFHDALESTTEFAKKHDWTNALNSVNEALKHRSDDEKEARKLQGEYQIEKDKADLDQCLQNAKNDSADDPSDAVVEAIKAAYGILDKPSNTKWSIPKRSEVDAIAKGIIDKLHERATKLADERQYDDAKKTLRLGLPLPSKDEKLSKLLKDIEEWEVNPETANISGVWETPGGGICKLTDSGGDTIRCEVIQLPQDLSKWSGYFTRKKEKRKEKEIVTLTGTFQVVFATGDRGPKGTVHGSIKDVKTLSICWQGVYWDDRGKGEWHGVNWGVWNKRNTATGESVTPDDTEEPRLSSTSARRHRSHPTRTNGTPSDRDPTRRDGLPRKPHHALLRRR